MKTKGLLLTLSSLTVSISAYADQPPLPAPSAPPPMVERDPAQTAVNTEAVVNRQSVEEGLLRHQQLSQQTQASGQVIKYRGKELMENPAILEELFVAALVSGNRGVLPVYIQLYERVPNHDKSLIEWAKAMLQRDEDLNKSVASYRSLSSNFPDNNYIRFQLAETLFYNQEFEAAKSQFERLRAAPSVKPQDIAVFDKYIEAINNKDDWNVSFGMTFLNDKNLANSAKQGTKAKLPNGATVSYSSPRQEGKGLSVWTGLDKRWSLSNGKYLTLDSNLSTKYYWDNKRYNDVNAHLGFGGGYSNARFDISFIPYIEKRWYGGGLSETTESLKQYSNTYGGTVSTSYWLNQNVRYSASYNYGYEKYERLRHRRLYDGAVHSVSNSMMYMPSARQYWSISLDFARKHARDKTNAYERIGTRLTWGQEWPLGISSSATVGVAKRIYKGKTYFGKRQDNDEYSTSLSLWHKKFHYAGFTPRITWSYTKTISNIPIYSYDKSQVFFDVNKSF